MIARPPRRPVEGGGVAVLLVVTITAWLAAPQVHRLRPLADQLRHGDLPTIPLPNPQPATRPPTAGAGGRAARAVAFALAQRGKPYRWGAEGPDAFDCSGLTWAAWQHAGVSIPRTAAGQLAGLPRVHGQLRPGDLVIYPSDGPSGRHVAMVVGQHRMVEALGRGVPVRSTPIRPGYLGVVQPGAGRMTAFLDVLGWDGLTAGEQAAALVGAGLGLAAWLLARIAFGGRRQR
jgi:cell wall-associated NlpC family hydrolase